MISSGAVRKNLLWGHLQVPAADRQRCYSVRCHAAGPRVRPVTSPAGYNGLKQDSGPQQMMLHRIDTTMVNDILV